MALESELQAVHENALLEKCLDLMISKSVSDISINLREARDHNLVGFSNHSYKFLLDRESVQCHVVDSIGNE